MANVIDALVMTLGLDTKDFNKGYKQSAEDLDKFRKQSDAVAKNVSEGGRKMAEGFSAVKTQLIGVLALLGASVGLKDFIASNVQGQAALGRLSRNLDISAKSLEAWGLVAKETGGTAEDAFGALSSVAAGLAEASIKGHSALTDAAAANGVNLQGAKDAEEVLIRISQRVAKLPRQQGMYLANQMGVGGMFNQLALGPEELKRRLESARGLTKVTQASTEAAERLQRKWARIQQRFKETSEIAFAKLSPVLERLAERFANWLDSIDWDKVTKQIGNLIDKVNSAVDAFGGWKNVAIALGAVLALKVLSPVLGLVGGLLRLAPLLVSTAAGLASIAVAGAALGGWKVGKAIYEDTGYANTKAADRFGSAVAHVLSFFGNEEAKQAIAERSAGDQTMAGKPRGVRNNNPGNLNYAGQQGAHLESGPGARFAAFGSMQQGISALVRQLAIYVSRGNDTITGIVNKYAPAKDHNNVSAYITALVRATGKDANDHLDLSDMKTLIPLVQGIVKHEGNGNLTTDQVMGGIRLGAQQRLAMRQGGNVSTRSSETHIAKIEVNTQATDARGIGADIRSAMQNNALVANADSGMN